MRWLGCVCAEVFAPFCYRAAASRAASTPWASGRRDATAAAAAAASLGWEAQRIPRAQTARLRRSHPLERSWCQPYESVSLTHELTAKHTAVDGVACGKRSMVVCSVCCTSSSPRTWHASLQDEARASRQAAYDSAPGPPKKPLAGPSPRPSAPPEGLTMPPLQLNPFAPKPSVLSFQQLCFCE